MSIFQFFSKHEDIDIKRLLALTTEYRLFVRIFYISKIVASFLLNFQGIFKNFTFYELKTNNFDTRLLKSDLIYTKRQKSERI